MQLAPLHASLADYYGVRIGRTMKVGSKPCVSMLASSMTYSP